MGQKRDKMGDSPVYGGSANYRANGVAVADGIAESLHKNGSNTVSSSIAVSGRVKGVASGRLRQDPSHHGGNLLLG